MSSKADKPVWHGAMTALVTPLGDDGGVDHAALARLAEWQVVSGIHALVPCGTTGEGATLSDEEHGEVVTTVVRSVAGRVPVIAGCGSNDTRRAVAGARRAAAAGADALLVVSPYYNKPNRSGMLAHFEVVARATELPLILYNVPGRTGQNLGADLILDLGRIPGVVGVKEASGSLEQISEILERRRPDFAVLSGDDALALPTLALGADGLISVASNAAPAEMARMISLALGGDFEEARTIHFRLLELMRANFVESNPVPVKAALELLGRCSGRVRAPLGPPAESTLARLRHALDLAGLVETPR